MNVFAAFSRAIVNGLFDEVERAEKNGTQRLTTAADSFVSEGSLTKEQQQERLERLDKCRLQRLQKPAP